MLRLRGIIAVTRALIASQPAGADCSLRMDNELRTLNCNFDSTPVGEWQFTGDGGLGHDTGDGFPGLDGAMTLSTGGGTATRCINAALPAGTYTVAFWGRSTVTQGMFASVTFAVGFYSDPNCAGVGDTNNAFLGSPFPRVWTKVEDVDAKPAAQSILLTVLRDGFSSANEACAADNLHLVPGDVTVPVQLIRFGID